jgi:hypothetical protein
MRAARALRARDVMLDRSLPLFPYVSMRKSSRKRTPLVSIANEVHVTLLHVSEPASRVLYREDLERAELDPVAAYDSARARLGRLVRARLVSVRVIAGPWRSRCLAFQHSFLAASCMVLPDLFCMAKDVLGTDTMCISLPRRDTMIVMPDLGHAFRVATRDLVRQRGGKERSCPLFALTPRGLGTLEEEIPVELGSMRDMSREIAASPW